MGDFAALQEIHLRAPEVTGIGTNHEEIEKNYKNYLTSLGIEPTTHQLRSCKFNHCATCYWLNYVLLLV